MTTSSAPGKIILFGEHAVVYGRPALAVPVTQVRAEAEVVASPRRGVWIDAPAVKLHAELTTLPSDHPIASVFHNFFFLAGLSPFPDLEVNITSTIPVASGLGSGAAVTVALTRALAAHLERPMTDDEVNAFTYEIEKLHHGTPSGIDNTVVTYARPIYFVRSASLPGVENVVAEEVSAFAVGQPFTLVIGDTGIAAPTRESVADVRKLFESNPKYWDNVFDQVEEISFAARHVIEEGWLKMLGSLMDENHTLLQELTVSSVELDTLVEAARRAGALGAKLSGGGRGGNMIALVEPEKAETVSQVLKEAGARNTIITQVT